MNKYIKFLIIAVGVIFLATACEKDIQDREESPLGNPNNTGLRFQDAQDFVLPLAENEFIVQMYRSESAQAQTINIKHFSDGKVTAPEAVSFAAGQDTADIKIVVKDLEPFKEYLCILRLDANDYDPYALENNSPEYKILVKQEDYTVKHKGIWTSSFFGASWDQDLEYSKMLDLWRFKGVFASGYNMPFKWDGSSKKVEIENTVMYKHRKYGPVTANWVAEECYYDAASKTLSFFADFTVSAGSFGKMTETYEITE